MFVIQLDTLTPDPVYVLGFSNTLATITTTWNIANALSFPTADAARKWAARYATAERYTTQPQPGSCSLAALYKEIEWTREHTLESMERLYLDGRVPSRQFRLYCLFWDWCAGHVYGPAADRQWALTQRYGRGFVLSRMNRFRRAAGYPALSE
jgi:hypothetical protein